MSTFTLKINDDSNFISSPFIEPLTINELKGAGCNISNTMNALGSSLGEYFYTLIDDKEYYVTRIGLNQAGSIWMVRGCTVTKTGTLPAAHDFEFKSVGTTMFSVSTETTLNEIKGTCDGKITSVQTINYSLPLDSPNRMYKLGENEKFYPGKGYYVKVDSPCSFKNVK
jgi:hypothetical protein